MIARRNIKQSHLLSLKNLLKFYSSNSSPNSRNVNVSRVRNKRDLANPNTEIEATRNVGIMAHIDAGKTTTTERMLYLSGVISNPGEVHHGDTVTDFLPQERERGITIQSAVVHFNWKDTTINLIDTPGHVDFTFEVQRSLRVVDSAIAILDATAGVEAQSLTVWRQANENDLPRLIFLNKMDRAKASEKLCLKSIQDKFKSTPILLQIPFYSKQHATNTTSGLIGLIDLISMKRIVFDAKSRGAKYIIDDITDKNILTQRCQLVDQLADFDSELANFIIENENIETIDAENIHKAIKRITMKNQAVPVLLGSSYKHIGVQPLLDAIIRYLPNPKEKKNKDKVVSAYGSELCSFAFKSFSDHQFGPMTFLRIFNGKLETGQKIYNATREKYEKILKIYFPFADELKEVKEIREGQVAVVSGLKDTKTGDTLTSSSSIASSVVKKLKAKSSSDLIKEITPNLTGFDIPEAVFFCSIEPASLSQQKLLESALESLQREDPSLRVYTDPDTSQTVLSGMGELHIEIIYERLKSDYKVDADLGKLSVAYKETTCERKAKRIIFERKFADKKHNVIIELEVFPHNNGPVNVRNGIGKEVIENLLTISEKHMKCIHNGVISSLRCGPKLNFPIANLDVHVNFCEISRGTSETIIEAAAASCLRQILVESNIVLLEPIVNLEISTDEKHEYLVNDDLNRRKFVMSSIDFRSGYKIISGKAPISELVGYSTALRTITSGIGTFSMHFSHYEPIKNPFYEAAIVKEVRGF